MSRIVQWPRGGPLYVWIKDSEITDHNGTPIDVADISGITVQLFESHPIEPPTALDGRAAVAMVHSTSPAEWGAPVAYGADLNPRDQVRLVVTMTASGTAFRLLDATAVFSAAPGQ